MIVTERLIFRPLKPTDLDELYYKLYSDAETMKYIRNGHIRTREETETTLNTLIEHYETHGFGFMAVLDRITQEFAGISGLKHLDTTGEVEVGFLFEKKRWGQGLATESAKALLHYAFTVLRKERIVAIAKPGNMASRRALEKAGLKFVDIRPFYGYEYAYYSALKS